MRLTNVPFMHCPACFADAPETKQSCTAAKGGEYPCGVWAWRWQLAMAVGAAVGCTLATGAARPNRSNLAFPPACFFPARLPAKFAGEKAKQALMNKIGKAPVVCEQARLLPDSVRLAEVHGRVPRLLCVPCLVPSCCPTPHPCAVTLSLPMRADETTKQVCCSVCSTNMLLCML